MKILMALAGLDIGGAETHVVELSKEIKRRGYDVVMVSGGGVYQKEVEEAGIRHYTVPIKRRSISDMARARRKLKKILKAEKPDLVHAHARIPAFLLHSIHQFHRHDFVFVTTAHWTFDTSPALKALTRWGDKTLAVSEDLKRYLLDNYRVKEKNIYISINGIDGTKFSKDIDGSAFAKEFSLTPGAKRISYVSRLNPAVCAPAYALIAELPAIDKAVPGVELIIVGDGDCYADMKQKAEDMNKQLGRTAVYVTGPRTDINQIHACADVCVGVSRAILEPMSMEKRCVVAGQEGYIGILNEQNLDTAIACNLTCRGCDPLDAARLREDVIKLFQMDDTEAKAVTDFEKYVVETHYSVKTMADDNLHMYADAMHDCGETVAILGYYGFGNTGDDALLRAILEDLREQAPMAGPVVLSFRPQKTRADYGVQSINRFNLFAIRRLFSRIHLFISGGGSLIQDVTSTKSLLYYLWMIRLAKKKGLPVMLYANGIGPVVKEKDRRRVAPVLNTVDCITLRDEASLQTLRDLGVTKPDITLSADPALGIRSYDTDGAKRLLQSYGLSDGEPFFCLSIRRWRGAPEGLDSHFAALADYIAQTYHLTPVFVPMQYEKDIPLCRLVQSKMKKRAVLLDQNMDTSLILGVMSLSEAAVAVRLHMLIFGTLLGLPVMGIDYDPKVRGFQTYIGQPYCLQPSQISDGSWKTSVDSFFQNRSAIRAEIEQILPSLQEKAKQSAVLAAKLINQ